MEIVVYQNSWRQFQNLDIVSPYEILRNISSLLLLHINCCQGKATEEELIAKRLALREVLIDGINIILLISCQP